MNEFLIYYISTFYAFIFQYRGKLYTVKESFKTNKRLTCVFLNVYSAVK